MARCFITRQLPGDGPAGTHCRSFAAHEVEVWRERLPPSPDELATHLEGAEGLLSLLTDRIDTALLDRAPRLRAIANYAVGYDNIDLAAAAARGIAVGNTPDVLTDATADLAFALLMAAARKLPDAMEAVRDGDWLGWEPARYLGVSAAGLPSFFTNALSRSVFARRTERVRRRNFVCRGGMGRRRDLRTPHSH